MTYVTRHSIATGAHRETGLEPATVGGRIASEWKLAITP